MKGWDAGQVGDFARQLNKTWKPHWHLMPTQFRTAVVAEFVLGLVMGQSAETVSVDSVARLRADLMAKMGLAGE